MAALPWRLAFLSGSPGAGELLLLFLIVLVLFGPKRLPDVIRTISRTLNELRRASQDFRDHVLSIEAELEADEETPAYGDAPDDEREQPRRHSPEKAEADEGRDGDARAGEGSDA